MMNQNAAAIIAQNQLFTYLTTYKPVDGRAMTPEEAEEYILKGRKMLYSNILNQ